MRVLTIFVGVAVFAGCAGTMPATDPTPMTGTWSFNGQVRGVNVYRNGPQEFYESVSGTLEIASGSVHLTSNRGSCTGGASAGGRRVGVSCPQISLRVDGRSGTVSIPIQVTREQRGACVAYDSNRRCVEWAWITRVETVRGSGTVVLTPAG